MSMNSCKCCYFDIWGCFFPNNSVHLRKFITCYLAPPAMSLIWTATQGLEPVLYVLRKIVKRTKICGNCLGEALVIC